MSGAYNRYGTVVFPPGETKNIRHPETVMSVSWFSNKIVSGCADGIVRVWDSHTGSELMNLQGHKGCVCSVSFSPDGNYIVSGADDSTVCVWDTMSRESVTSDEPGGRVNSVSWSPKGDKIAAGTDDGTVIMWDFMVYEENNKKIMELSEFWNDPGPNDARAVTSVSFSPNGAYALICWNDRTMRMFDLETTNSMMGQLSGSATENFIRTRSVVRSASFSPGGDYFVTGSDDHKVRVWQVIFGRQPGALTLTGHTAKVTSVSWSLDGTKIVSGSADKSIIVWDLHNEVNENSDQLVFRAQINKFLNGHTEEVTSLSFSPDSNSIVSGSVDKTMRVWYISATENVVYASSAGRMRNLRLRF